MRLGGFAGKLLFVDLTNGEISKEPLDLGMATDFIGGLGLTVSLAHQNITPGTQALAPENPIVLGAGPLVGTDFPASSRLFSITKLPTSGTIGWSGAGGVTFGAMLKNAGYDQIVIKGRADRPVYLEITDDRVALRDASALWGKGVSATCDALWKDHTRPTGVLSIGQGGENLVKFSMAFIDRIATLGRGGFGAVMGAKNLKAIVARGTGGVTVADRKATQALREDILGRMRDYPYLKEWQELGMIKSFPFVEKETYFQVKKRRVACVSCPAGCKDVVEIRDGELKGLVVCSSSAINLFTPIIYGMKDHRQAIKLIADLDEYGLDMFEFLGLMVFAKALSENGLIPRGGTDPRIVVESLESMEAWAGKIARREGLGDVFANGFDGVIAEFGEEARQLAPALVKGMHPYAGPAAALPWHLFGTMELGQVLDPRGPHVGSSGSPTYFAKRSLDVFPKHLTRMGVSEDEIAALLQEGPQGRKEGLEVGRLLRHAHRWFAILGSLGVCARAQINRFQSASFCAQVYQAVTGIDTSLEQIRERADRAWTLLRLANLREGFQRRREETLPSQWFGESGFKDYVNEQPLALHEAEGMIDDYYRAWDWDPETGVPTEQALERLGLQGLR
jgi:aldehyde:ferredoxin oxidoreductase